MDRVFDFDGCCIMSLALFACLWPLIALGSQASDGVVRPSGTDARCLYPHSGSVLLVRVKRVRSGFASSDHRVCFRRRPDVQLVAKAMMKVITIVLMFSHCVYEYE